jgi:hypothetical protein
VFLHPPANQLDRHLQLVLNSAASAVANTPKCHHITPILKYLHWLEITERIHYKVLYITYKCLLSDKPTYLRNLLTFRVPPPFVILLSLYTLKRPYDPSRLKVPGRSFYHSAPSLWNTLPKEFRQLNSTHSESQPLLSSYHLLNFTRNLKLIFSLLLFLPSLIRACLPPGLFLWFSTLALCFSFIVIFICHSPSPHSLLFILWLNLVYSVANKACIFMFSFLQQSKSSSVTFIPHIYLISYFSFSPHNFC